MRKFALGYVIVVGIICFLMVEFQVYPATIVINWFVDGSGRFIVMLVVGVMLIFGLLPLLFIFLIYNFIVARKQDSDATILDQTGILIKRDKALYGAVFPMEIIVNGKKIATVTIGKSTHVALPLGEHVLEVRAMEKGVITKINLADNRMKTYKVGFRMGGNMQDVYMDEITEDFQ